MANSVGIQSSRPSGLVLLLPGSKAIQALRPPFARDGRFGVLFPIRDHVTRGEGNCHSRAMADTSGSNESQKGAWPPELKDFAANLFLREGMANLEPLGRALAGLAPEGTDPTRPFAVRLFLPDPDLPTVARLGYRPSSAYGGGTQITLSVQAPVAGGTNPESKKDLPNWEDAWKIIDQHLLQAGKDVEFYVNARLEFSMESWLPVASLPTPMAGLVPDIAGVALLTGFSLEFPEQRHPIRRLSITVYPSLREIDGRLNFFVAQSSRNTLPTAVVKIITSYQGLIAKPAPAETTRAEITAQ